MAPDTCYDARGNPRTFPHRESRPCHPAAPVLPDDRDVLLRYDVASTGPGAARHMRRHGWTEMRRDGRVVQWYRRRDGA